MAKRVAELRARVEALREADNALAQYSRMPVAKKRARKLAGGVVGEVMKFDGRRVTFQVAFEGLEFAVDVFKEGIEVVSLEIRALGGHCQVQDAIYVEKLVKAAKDACNVTLFLRGMSRWEEESVAHQTVLAAVQKHLEGPCSAVDKNTIALSSGHRLAIFTGESPGASWRAYLDDTDISEFVDPRDGPSLARFANALVLTASG